MKIKIAILDDNKVHLKIIKEKVQKHICGEELEIATFTTSKELLDSKEEYDILLVDVELQTPKEGLQTVLSYRECNKESIVILISSHESMVQEGFEVKAFRYVYKTQLDTDLKRALKAALDEIKANLIVDIVMPGNVKIQAKTKDIIKFEKKADLTEMLLRRDSSTLFIKNTLKDLEAQLKSKGFIRISKVALLNIRYISMVAGKYVAVKNGNFYNLSRKYKNDVQIAYWNKRTESE